MLLKVKKLKPYCKYTDEKGRLVIRFVLFKSAMRTPYVKRFVYKGFKVKIRKLQGYSLPFEYELYPHHASSHYIFKRYACDVIYAASSERSLHGACGTIDAAMVRINELTQPMYLYFLTSRLL